MIDWEQFYSHLRTPDFLPGYEIQNRLGSGAFGEVYKATKVSISKMYAVKFLKVADGAVVNRELEQVSLFAAIDHPHLVSVEDVGVVEGVPYVIMGYAGEDTLSLRMRRGELKRESMLRIFVQVCRGVLALHDRRLAHFDLKPSNVFLKGDIARVGDYGLSKLIADGKQTLSFGRGSPSYMAPEMLRNRADHRADIYSLGVILYELMEGKLPFDMNGEMFVREEDVPPDFSADFPKALQTVVTRATRFRAEDRYTSVQDLLGAMGEIAADPSTVSTARTNPELQAERDYSDIEQIETLSESIEDETIEESALRRTASELARGAAGVARGVWDGVRARSSEAFRRPSKSPDAESKSENPLGGEVLSFHTLEDPDVFRDEGGGGGAASGESSRSPILGMLARERKRRGSNTHPGAGSERGAEDSASSGSQTFSPWNALPAMSAASVGRTVPVPPAVDGGIIGSVAATLVLGFEVMVSIVSGPVFSVLRGVGRSVDRAFQPAPGVFGSTLKLLIFLALLAGLGGLITLISIFVLIG
ncbi:MAG: serine/threonine protein kinase [Planctomycetota bacterium]|jgi:serine/threonine protein kinase